VYNHACSVPTPSSDVATFNAAVAELVICVSAQRLLAFLVSYYFAVCFPDHKILVNLDYCPGARARVPASMLPEAGRQSRTNVVDQGRRVDRLYNSDLAAADAATANHRQFDEESFSEVLTYYGSTNNVQVSSQLHTCEHTLS